MSLFFTKNAAEHSRKGGAFTFALLFSLESFVRSMNASVIPIQAYDLLGSSRNVSIVATSVSLAVLITTLLLPIAFSHLRRRWAYTLGISFSVAAALFLASYTVAGQIGGNYFRNAGASIMNVTLSLYILDHIHKTDYARAEPIRLAVSTISWSTGPVLGVWLYTQYGPWAPQLLMFVACIVLLIVFWVLRLADPKTLPQGTIQTSNPLANVREFIRQPRLRLAWTIAFGRSCFWSALFIYGPILMIEGGLSKQQGGMVISASQLLLPLAILFGMLALRITVRKVITLSFVGISLSCAAAGFFGVHSPWSAVGCLLLAATFATALDGVGGIPFMRAVKHRQRQQMASVYRTFIEMAEIVPGMVFAVVLTIFETGAVFVLVAALSSALALLCWRYLPKSL
jgi:MFS family permease